MSSNAHALPRARVRRRKIRPPHPWWFIAVANVAASLLVVAQYVAKSATGSVGLHAAIVIASGVCQAWVYWPAIRSPYKPVVPSVPQLMFTLALNAAVLATH